MAEVLRLRVRHGRLAEALQPPLEGWDPRAGGTEGKLVRWVLSWMPDVKALAPKSLRDRIALKLEAGLRHNAEIENGPNQTLHTNRSQARGR